MSFLGRKQPWETVLNFSMASLCAIALLIVGWVATVRRGFDWGADNQLVLLTFMVGIFVVPRAWKWLRNDAR